MLSNKTSLNWFEPEIDLISQSSTFKLQKWQLTVTHSDMFGIYH